MFNDVKFDFCSKNFIVVGASSGMGRQIVLDLARAGANVLAVARNIERLNEVKNHFSNNIIIESLDVLQANKENWDNVISSFVNKYGKCCGGVYTAGIAGATSIRSFDIDYAKDIFDTSFWGMVNFIQAFAKRKFIHKSSSFVVFSSVGSHDGLKGNFVYSAAKAAARISVKAIAKEICRDGHRINSISPGLVDTPMVQDTVQNNETKMISTQNMFNCHRLGIGKAEDVSAMTLFLLSDAARWITGTDVVVDGGFLLGID